MSVAPFRTAAPCMHGSSAAALDGAIVARAPVLRQKSGTSSWRVACRLSSTTRILWAVGRCPRSRLTEPVDGLPSDGIKDEWRMCRRVKREGIDEAAGHAVKGMAADPTKVPVVLDEA